MHNISYRGAEDYRRMKSLGLHTDKKAVEIDEFRQKR